MKVSDLFEQLSQGELREYKFSGSDNAGIQPVDYQKVIPHINLGLLELHKRFPLKIKELTVQQYENIQLYIMHPRHSRTNTESIEPIKYIMDSSFMPFRDDKAVLKIENVFKEDGSEYILNDNTNPFSIFTPSYNSVQIPFNDSSNVFTVQYRTNHPTLISTGEGVLDQEVDLSPTHLEALLIYVAARYISAFGTPEATQTANNYFVRFENACQMNSINNLVVRENPTNLKLDMNRWP